MTQEEKKKKVLNNKETVALSKVCCTVVEKENADSLGNRKAVICLASCTAKRVHVLTEGEANYSCSGPTGKTAFIRGQKDPEIQPGLATQEITSERRHFM